MYLSVIWDGLGSSASYLLPAAWIPLSAYARAQRHGVPLCSCTIPSRERQLRTLTRRRAHEETHCAPRQSRHLVSLVARASLPYVRARARPLADRVPQLPRAPREAVGCGVRSRAESSCPDGPCALAPLVVARQHRPPPRALSFLLPLQQACSSPASPLRRCPRRPSGR